MSKPRRLFVIVFFIYFSIFTGGAGAPLLALSGKAETDLKLYTELLTKAHEHYGTEIPYRDLVYASVHGLFRTLDPHSMFLAPEAYASMRQRQQSSFYGLGILISMRNGQLTVISPIEGTPAWRLGIRAGDVITVIEGEPTDTLSLDEAVNRLKGPKGTQVNIQIVRRALEKPLELAITRAEIPQNTVRYAYMMADKTGYIRLTDFTRSTTREIRDALEDLENEGMERLILDLRSNGGGLLDQAVGVSGFFVPEGSRIVETRGRTSGSYMSFTDDDGQEMLDLPLVVLVNRGTASAAEIVAGAVQDYDIGLVAGTPTWGKGLVQTVYNLSYRTAIALTTAKYYTPSGRLIQRDYTSLYDYYTDFDGAEGDPPDMSVKPEFSTFLGRKVYGGGGITPDVLAELPDGPLSLQPLFILNAFFNFAVDYHDSHAVENDWKPAPELLEDFRHWLVDEEVVSEEDLEEIFVDDGAESFALRQIHSDVFTVAFGPEAAHRALAEGDSQIQAALELFDEAAELLAERHRLLGDQKGLFASAAERRELEKHEIVLPDKDDSRPE
jgi:carboxyl-terminal processing protease